MNLDISWRFLSKVLKKGMAWFLLAAYSKMQGERKKLKKEFLSIEEPELEDLENSQPICTAKNEKVL